MNAKRLSIIAAALVMLGACAQSDENADTRAPAANQTPASAQTQTPEARQPQTQPPGRPEPVASSSFVDQVVTLDTHVDIPFDFATPAVDPLSADLQVNLEKMRRGGLDAAFFIVYVGQTARTPESYAAAERAAMTKFDAIHRMTDELYPETIGLAYTPANVERLIAEGKLAAAIGIENGFVIGQNLNLLDRYHELGARYMTLVHNGHNDIADSAMSREDLGDTSAAEHGGVSEFGERVIERMNDLGIMVDVSHASKQSALDAIRLSRLPVIASHSGVYGVAAHPRNMDDETLLALKENGGVVQIVAFDSYLTLQPPDQIEAQNALRTRLGLSNPVNVDALPEAQRMEFLRGTRDIQRQWPPSDVEDFIDHVDYAVNLIGVDHVGISSDFGGGGGVIGWTDASETPNVTQEMLRRGYSEEDIEKIWSGNLLRVWAAVEAGAASASESVQAN